MQKPTRENRQVILWPRYTMALSILQQNMKTFFPRHRVRESMSSLTNTLWTKSPKGCRHWQASFLAKTRYPCGVRRRTVRRAGLFGSNVFEVTGIVKRGRAIAGINILCMSPANVRHELHRYSHKHGLGQTRARIEVYHFFSEVP